MLNFDFFDSTVQSEPPRADSLATKPCTCMPLHCSSTLIMTTCTILCVFRICRHVHSNGDLHLHKLNPMAHKLRSTAISNSATFMWPFPLCQAITIKFELQCYCLQVLQWCAWVSHYNLVRIDSLEIQSHLCITEANTGPASRVNATRYSLFLSQYSKLWPQSWSWPKPPKAGWSALVMNLNEPEPPNAELNLWF